MKQAISPKLIVTLIAISIEIRQAQPKFHEELTCLNARALSAKSESMKPAGWNKRYFLSFPSYPPFTQTRQMGSEKARDVIIPVSS